MEELFGIIGRLYVEMHHAQKYIETIQAQLKDKDNEIVALKAKMSSSLKDKDLNIE
jgi:hypothetical protein